MPVKPRAAPASRRAAGDHVMQQRGQSALTVVARVEPERYERLDAVLRAMGADPAGNAVLPIGAYEEVHFARLVLLEPDVDLAGKGIPPQLLLMSDVDGTAADFLAKLAGRASLDRVFENCAGYPLNPSPAARLAYLSNRRVEPDTLYINWIGRTVEQVRMEARLREALETFLDSADIPASERPTEVRRRIQAFMAREPSLAWALEPMRPAALAWRLGEWAHLAGAVVLVLIVALPALILVPFVALLLRMHEKRDVPDRASVPPDQLERLSALEDHVTQNPFSAVGCVKPGLFRRLTLIVVLWVTNLTTRHVFNRGSLTGVVTIHFARWVFLDGKRRLIFASNYDGSLESYMDDFIDKVAWGLNAVFSNGQGYPRTDWLVVGGARDEQAFKNFLRRHQVPTQVWYSAYPNLTARNVKTNALIREGLAGDMSDAQASAWLELL